jgi:hypothetical protein
MKLFEITLPGFDGSTDATDDKVLWVGCPDETELRLALSGWSNVTICGEITSERNIETLADYILPCDASRFIAHLNGEEIVVCTQCGSEDIYADAYVGINPHNKDEVLGPYQQTYCTKCEQECGVRYIKLAKKSGRAA